MSRVYDSADGVQEFPADAQTDGNGCVAYIDGDFVTNVTGFKGTVQYITVLGKSAPHILWYDIEKGDGTAESWGTWALKQRANGAQYGAYCNKNTWPSVITVAAKLGLIDVPYFIADPEGNTEHLVPGSVQTQWGFDGTYDVSYPEPEWYSKTFPQAVHSDSSVPSPAPNPGISGAATSYESDNMKSYPLEITTDANGWTAVGLPSGVDPTEVVSVVMNWGSAYDDPSNPSGGWLSCDASVDVNGKRLVFTSSRPNSQFSGKVWVVG